MQPYKVRVFIELLINYFLTVLLIILIIYVMQRSRM